MWYIKFELEYLGLITPEYCEGTVLQLSREADYAIRVLTDIASQSVGKRVIMRDIAERQGVPMPFLAKIVRRLREAQLLVTYRGSEGGLALTRPATDISLLEIVQAIEGPLGLNRCTMQPSQCRRDVFCTVRPIWLQAQTYLTNLLGNTRLSDVQSSRGSRGRARATLRSHAKQCCRGQKKQVSRSSPSCLC